MKKILAIAVVLLVLIGVFFALRAAAEDDNSVTVTLDGNVIDCAKYGQPAAIVDGRTLVPLRAIFEALGATVGWDEKTRCVTSTLEETTITLIIGENKLVKNGEEIILDVPAMIMNDRTLVPVRAVSESFGVLVEWHARKRTVILTTPVVEEPEVSEEPEENEESKPSKRPSVSKEPEKDTEEDEPAENTGIHMYGDFYFDMSIKDAKKLVKDAVVSESESLIEVVDADGKCNISDETITGEIAFCEMDLGFENGGLVSLKAYTAYDEDSAPLMRALLTSAMYYGDGYVFDKENRSYTWNREDGTVRITVERNEDMTYRLLLEIHKN